MAITLLCDSSRAVYDDVGKKITAATGVKLPSYHLMTKNRPSVLPIIINKMGSYDNQDGALDLAVTVDENQTSTDINTLPVLITVDNTKGLSEGEALEMVLRKTSESGNTVMGGVIEGGYGKYLKHLVEKHKSRGRILREEEEGIVIDSIDGAEHLKSKKQITSVISFSSSLVCSRWLAEARVKAGSSLNILTWMQLRGTESVHVMMPAVKSYFEEKKVIRDENQNNEQNISNNKNKRKFWFYEVHDGKMLYLLTQHSLWNRKYHPFLICSCSRGAGVKDPSHVCTPLTNAEHLVLFNLSKRRWYTKRESEKAKGNKIYGCKEHLNWVDKKNKGCSHFGVHPLNLPREDLRFDTFHLKCAITRRLMAYLRNFIMKQTLVIVKDFNTLLKSFYNDYHLYIWNNNKNFASFLGNEIALFVGNTEAILFFLDKNMIATPELLSIAQSLSLWVKLWKFLSISHLRGIHPTAYIIQMLKFEENLQQFYAAGSRTFLTKAGNVGVEETFYLHTLRYYMPVVAHTTFVRHRTGVAIFTMQGFERRNKESKYFMKRFSNNAGNTCLNNMKRLWDRFFYDTTVEKIDEDTVVPITTIIG